MNSIFNIALFQNIIRTSTVILLASMGGLMTQHAGIMNIGMDGMILLGAFFAVVGSFFFASAAIGVLFAVLCGIIIGLLFALLVVKLKSDEFIIGVALNIFAGGLTVFLSRSIFGVKGTFSSPKIMPLPKINLAFLAKVPVIGKLLNNNSIFVLLSFVLVFACYIFIYKTPQGFWLRASGEHPKALKSSGISPTKMKFTASILCGIFCALAGAHLSLGYLTLFSEGMSASRGFIAFAIVIFGKANPIKCMFAALLFGFFEALGLRLQSASISSQLTSTIPYIATILMLIYVAFRSKNKIIKQR